jgi:prepilin-type N-terminal cleavage/methylation domain-containing protein
VSPASAHTQGPSSSAGTATRSRAGDAGVTLIELLMSVAILGVAFVVIVGGMFTFVRGASAHQTQSNVGLYARQYADALTATAYVTTCPSTYAAVGYTPPAGYTVTNSVTFWNDYTSAFTSTCANGDGRLQRVRAVVSAPGVYSVTVDVIKRAP